MEGFTILARFFTWSSTVGSDLQLELFQPFFLEKSFLEKIFLWNPKWRNVTIEWLNNPNNEYYSTVRLKFQLSRLKYKKGLNYMNWLIFFPSPCRFSVLQRKRLSQLHDTAGVNVKAVFIKKNLNFFQNSSPILYYVHKVFFLIFIIIISNTIVLRYSSWIKNIFKNKIFWLLMIRLF